MGQYLQMGICYRMEIDKNRLEKLGIKYEKLTSELNKHLDLSLFELNETKDEIIFEIKESVVLEQLQKFLGFQYSMYPQELPYTDCFEPAMKMISELSSLKDIVELAEEKKYPCFQSNRIIDEIKVSEWGKWLNIDSINVCAFCRREDNHGRI
ncbi:hypothetical protein VQ056_24205 [Paenibacillus sp. JTLBN-2024]